MLKCKLRKKRNDIETGKRKGKRMEGGYSEG